MHMVGYEPDSMNNPSLKRHQTTRVVMVVVIILLVAAIHAFRIGSYLNGELYVYYYSYASDIMLPFGAYFMLSMNEIQLRFLRKWQVKAAIVFGAMAMSEILQYFDVYFFGVNFDVVDMLMYGVGILCAAFFDKLLFEKYVPFWKYIPYKTFGCNWACKAEV